MLGRKKLLFLTVILMLIKIVVNAESLYSWLGELPLNEHFAEGIITRDQQLPPLTLP